MAQLNIWIPDAEADSFNTEIDELGFVLNLKSRSEIVRRVVKDIHRVNIERIERFREARRQNEATGVSKS